jgi:hypothetical protein
MTIRPRLSSCDVVKTVEIHQLQQQQQGVRAMLIVTTAGIVLMKKKCHLRRPCQSSGDASSMPLLSDNGVLMDL